MIYGAEYKFELTQHLELYHKSWKDVYCDIHKRLEKGFRIHAYGLVNADGRFLLLNAEQFALGLYYEVALHKHSHHR